MVKYHFSDVKETMKYRMPAFVRNDKWVAMANQKNYLSLYFCRHDLIQTIKEKYPRISCGKACIRFKDNDEFRLQEIEKSIIQDLV